MDAVLRGFADVHTTDNALHIELQRVRAEDKGVVMGFCRKADEFEVLGVVRKIWNAPGHEMP